jgi:hypothetical protein
LFDIDVILFLVFLSTRQLKRFWVKANKAFTKSLGVLAVASKLTPIIIIEIDLTIFLFKKLLLFFF